MQHVHNILPDYVKGKLDEPHHREVSAHLEACAECRAASESVGEVFRSMQTLSQAQPPAGYFSNVLPRVRQRLERVERFSWLKRPFVARFAAPLAAVIILVALSSRISFDQAGDQASDEFITLDDVAEALVRQNETQLLASVTVEQFAASTLPEEAFDRPLAELLALNGDAYSFDDLAGTSTDQMLENLNEQEIETLLKRLEERSLTL